MYAGDPGRLRQPDILLNGSLPWHNHGTRTAPGNKGTYLRDILVREGEHQVSPREPRSNKDGVLGIDGEGSGEIFQC